jgi:hypothetical protein
MTLDKWIVLVVALAAIGGLNWNYIRGVNRRDAARKAAADAARTSRASDAPSAD